MMKIIFGILFCITATNLYAKPNRGCGVDRITERNMQLENYKGSQVGTTIFIHCNSGYQINFRSRNLRNSLGDSFLQNNFYPNYKVNTRMSINGNGGAYLWGRNINGMTGSNIKYSIAVELVDNPNRNLPAGKYEDAISVSISF